MLESEFVLLCSNEEFLKETGAWIHESARSLLQYRDLFKDIANPEKTKDRDCNESLFKEFIESNYHSINNVGVGSLISETKGQLCYTLTSVA